MKRSPLTAGSNPAVHLLLRHGQKERTVIETILCKGGGGGMWDIMYVFSEQEVVAHSWQVCRLLMETDVAFKHSSLHLFEGALL